MLAYNIPAGVKKMGPQGLEQFRRTCVLSNELACGEIFQEGAVSEPVYLSPYVGEDPGSSLAEVNELICCILGKHLVGKTFLFEVNR